MAFSMEQGLAFQAQECAKQQPRQLQTLFDGQTASLVCHLNAACNPALLLEQLVRLPGQRGGCITLRKPEHACEQH